jgi:8-oxo-dGTP pyrophosphatase MutT (NUDIX family)
MQLAGHQPIDDREALSMSRFHQELARLPHPFDEHADSTHVTGSAIVVGPRGVVLHLHKRLGLWLQPGGHIEAGETPWDAAAREAREETGLDVRHPMDGVRLVHVDVHPGPRGHTHLDVRYLLEADDAAPNPAPGESPEVRWFSWDEAVAVADPGLLGALRTLRPS